MMENRLKPGVLCIAVLATLVSGCDKIKDLPVGKGFTSKYLCSYLFNSELDGSLVIDRFIKPKVQPLPLVWDIDVDYDLKTVTVGDKIFLNDSARFTSIYREKMGCTLLVGQTVERVNQHTVTPSTPPQLDEHLPWPVGTAGVNSSALEALDQPLLEQALEEAFREPDEGPRNTSSLLVAYKGQLIAERYALGVQPATPVLGWSMTKSISATLIGILHDQGRVALDEPAPIPGWRGTDKETITLRDILHMTSGLDFVEDYGQHSDVTQMLYTHPDQINYAASLPLIRPPGTVFNYNTGDANLLAKIVHDTAGGSTQDAYDFYQQHLFYRIGITSALIEVDAFGQFVGGAYGFMSPRDWLRLGQLYLQKGNWRGEQVVSSEWIELVTSPSPVTDIYGGQIWLNSRGSLWASVPYDAYAFLGHQGQRVVVIPSKELVILRTGVTEDYDLIGLDTVIPMIIDALPEPELAVRQ